MSSEATSSDYVDDELRGEDFGPSIDDNALAAAARQARLPFDRPTEHELAFFPELWEHKTAVEVFLLIRNSTLATWQYNPQKECTASDVRNNIFPPFNSDLDLIQNVVHFLTRHGLINFGRYVRSTRITRFLVRDRRKVIIIGAGTAGISAAIQLISTGFDVTILEGRGRIGGRVHSFKTKSGQVMETGGDTLRKLEDSPMTTLLHQVSLEEHGVYDYTTIYVDGKPLNDDKIHIFLTHYESAKGALNWEAHQREHRDENGLFVSRQRAYENLMNLSERSTLIKYFNHCKSLEEVARAREKHYNQMKNLRNTALMAENRLKKLEEQGLLDNDPIMRRSLKRDVATSIQKFDEVSNAFEAADNHWKLLNEHPQAKQFMHPGSDFNTYNFMLGFEEYLIGAQLEKVQFSCDSAVNKEHGVAARLTEGVAELLLRITQRRNLDIHLNHKVVDIDYSGVDDVKVRVQKKDGEIEELTAAIVISTLPIGVLKKSIAGDARAPTFTPPLPAEKAKSIRNMGSGLINKCILEFDKAFWATGSRANNQSTQFVTVSPNIRTRGSLSIWSSTPGSKVLTTYMVGDSCKDSPDDVIIQRALQTLHKVFGNNCPRTPLSAHITRWHEDEFAFGSGSFMSLRTEKSDFDELMKPLKTSDGKNRVYFAGEHTSSSYAATIQGAWMSGARAAADIANDYVGFGFVDMSGTKNVKGEDEEGGDMHIDHDGPLPEGMLADGQQANGGVVNGEIPEAKKAKIDN
ncbi:CRE-SPR-5 protein [Caenorhabditis remanei]|uniref:Lysine-specific histone demethylase n=1 Tax=Caenorhabditis remanei TaxID=31234 RepID=E3M8V1_CAERE|nr:CRE-SPR-5 protein [Caenorhabditis remanei]